MRTQQEINELAFLVQEAISLGATKYVGNVQNKGYAITERWLETSKSVHPYRVPQLDVDKEGGLPIYEQDVMSALQANGHCIPTYTPGIDPDFLAYLEEQNELD